MYPFCMQSLKMEVCHADEDLDDEVVISMGGRSVHSPQQILSDVLQAAVEEDIVKESSFGQAILAIIVQLRELDLTNFAQYVAKEIENVLFKSVKDVPSRTVKLSGVWRRFHCLRLSADVKLQWMVIFNNVCISPELPAGKLSDIVLQIVLSRMMGAFIHQLKSNDSTPSPQVTALTMREKNAIRYVCSNTCFVNTVTCCIYMYVCVTHPHLYRYMAGYVISKLKKKFSKRTASPDEAHQVYTRLLKSMKANFDEDCVSSVEDYTRFWIEQIDRGGLYHINDDVFALFTEIELVCRQFLDERTVPKAHLQSCIVDAALGSQDVLMHWHDLTECEGTEADTCVLLREIIILWSTIRIHSFAEGWTDKFQKNSRKGTRKTLQQKGTPKDSSQS